MVKRVELRDNKFAINSIQFQQCNYAGHLMCIQIHERNYEESRPDLNNGISKLV